MNLANHNNSPTFFTNLPLIFCNMRLVHQREVRFNLFCIKIKVTISMWQCLRGPVYFQAIVCLYIHDKYRLQFTSPSSNNTLLAHGTRQILENTEFVLLCSSMFGIVLFSFVLLLINDRWLAMYVSQHSPKFFLPMPAVALFAKLFDCQSFLLYST